MAVLRAMWYLNWADNGHVAEVKVLEEKLEQLTKKVEVEGKP